MTKFKNLGTNNTIAFPSESGTLVLASDLIDIGQAIPIVTSVAGGSSVTHSANAGMATWDVLLVGGTSKQLTITVSNEGYTSYAILGDWNLDCEVTADSVNGELLLIINNNTSSDIEVTTVLR